MVTTIDTPQLFWHHIYDSAEEFGFEVNVEQRYNHDHIIKMFDPKYPEGSYCYVLRRDQLLFPVTTDFLNTVTNALIAGVCTHLKWKKQ